jgi:hypothetical protein
VDADLSVPSGVTLVVAARGASITVANTITLTVASGGILKFDSTASSSPATIATTGTGQVEVNGTLNVTGAYPAPTANITLGDGSTLAGTFTAATGAITFSPGTTLNVTADLRITGDGSGSAGGIKLGSAANAGIYNLTGSGTIHLVTAVGSLFQVGAGQVLNLTGVTLEGLTLPSSITTTYSAGDIPEITTRAASLASVPGFTADALNNTQPLVYVGGAGAVLNLKGGARVVGNTIAISSSTMPGAGVWADAAGHLNIENGEIAWNTILATVNGYGMGGGVSVNSATGAMSGGSISNNLIVAMRNAASGTLQAGVGGGLYIGANNAGPAATFNFTGGAISNNLIGGTSAGQISGGGVSVHSSNNGTQLATFNMSGSAKVTGNKLVYKNDTKLLERAIAGSGVNVSVMGSTFNMSGGEISGNSIESHGRSCLGAVYTASVFTMTGGVIKGNTATSTKTVPVAGVLVINGTTTTLSGSAQITDRVTLSPAVGSWPKLVIPGALSSTLTIDLHEVIGTADTDFTNGTYGWTGKPILTGPGAGGAISKVTLGNFVKNSVGGDTAPCTPKPIGTAPSSGYELTAVSGEAVLTAS